MPAWMTSLLRDEVTVPIASAAYRMINSRPARASRRAIARPITPAPMTTHSTLSIRLQIRDCWAALPMDVFKSALVHVNRAGNLPQER